MALARKKTTYTLAPACKDHACKNNPGCKNTILRVKKKSQMRISYRKMLACKNIPLLLHAGASVSLFKFSGVQQLIFVNLIATSFKALDPEDPGRKQGRMRPKPRMRSAAELEEKANAMRARQVREIESKRRSLNKNCDCKRFL